MDEVLTYQRLLQETSPAGVRHAVETGRLVRLRAGRYAPGPDPALRLRAAAVQHAVPRAVISHRTAAALWGIGEPGGRMEVSVPHDLGLPSSPSLLVHRVRRPPASRLVDGLALTSAARTVVNVARTAPHPMRVEVADAALAVGHITVDDLRRELGHHGGLTGVGRARQAVALCRAGAQSPAETRLRLLLTGAGLPEPVLQHPIRTPIGTCHVDLAWPGRRVAVEYDGYAWHGGPEAFARDRRRWRALAQLGWAVHPVSGADMHDGPSLVAEIRAALISRPRIGA